MNPERIPQLSERLDDLEDAVEDNTLKLASMTAAIRMAVALLGANGLLNLADLIR